MANRKAQDPHAETKRSRDLAVIRDLFSIFPSPVVDQVLDQAARDYIQVDHISCLDGAEEVFRSNRFYLYDRELHRLLDELFSNWNAAWHVGRTTHHDHLHRGVATLNICDTDPQRLWEEHDAYLAHVARAQAALAGITARLHEEFPEFDLTESDREANRKYW